MSVTHKPLFDKSTSSTLPLQLPLPEDHNEALTFQNERQKLLFDALMRTSFCVAYQGLEKPPQLPKLPSINSNKLNQTTQRHSLTLNIETSSRSPPRSDAQDALWLITDFLRGTPRAQQMQRLRSSPTARSQPPRIPKRWQS